MTIDWHSVDRWTTGESWVGSQLMEHFAKLCDEIGPRWATTEAESKTVDYISGQMKRQGLSNVHLEEFDYETWDPGRSTAQVQGETVLEIDSMPLLFSPPTEVTARLVDAGFGTDHEIDKVRESLPGTVVIVDAGYEPFTEPSPFADRLRALSNAGTVAAVVVNAVGGRFLSYASGNDWVDGDIPTAMPMPAVLTSREDGARLRRSLSQEIQLKLNVATSFRMGTSANTVADIPGEKWPDEHIILCAHHDTIPDAPGANDDTSGVNVVLEVARVLSDLRNELGVSPGRTLRFVTFGAEEQMLQGSRAYVKRHFGDEELPHLVVNLDELAVGPMKGVILQFPELRDFVQGQMDTMGDQLTCHVLEMIDKSGDSFPFARRGIPAAFLWRWRFAGRHPDANYSHSDSDTIDKIRIRDLKEYVGLTARLLLRLSHVPTEEWPKNTLDVNQIEDRLEKERGKVMRV